MPSRSLLSIAFGSFLWSALLSTSSVADCVDYGRYLHVTGSIYLSQGSAYDVAVSGKYAYVADGVGGLQVLDISNLAAPTLVGMLDTQNALGIGISGSYTYIADVDTVRIVDISNPASPIIVRNVDNPDQSLAVAISGTYVYVATATAGIQVIDTSNPSTATIVASIDTPGRAQDIVISGSHAYVADGSSGLQVIDISNPLSPAIVGNVDTPGSGAKVAVSGPYAYVADGIGGLVVIDVSDVAHPFIAGTSVLPRGGATDVAATGKFAYVLSDFGNVYGGALWAVDVSLPATPVTVGVANVGSWSSLLNAITLSGSHVYVAFSLGVQVVDISNSVTPVHASIAASGFVAASGTYAYTYDNGTIRVINISNPVAPAVVGTLSIPATTGAIAGQGSYAYVNATNLSNQGTLYVIDISNRAAPALRGSTVYGGGYQFVVSGSYVYVASAGLKVIDVSNPAAPALVKSLPISGSWYYVTVSGSYAYLAGDFLRVINISNPLNPIVVGSASFGGPMGVYGTYLYVVERFGSLDAVDVSNPSSPTWVSGLSLESGYAIDIDIAGSVAYVVTGREVVHAIDLTNPIVPQRVGALGPVQGAVQIAMSTSYICALGTNVLTLLPMHCPGITGINPDPVDVQSRWGRLEQSRPNPFQGTSVAIPFVLSAPGWVRLRVLDLSGRQIRLLVNQEMQSGRNEAIWDGWDDHGHMTPRGVYFYELETTGFREARRMVKLQ
jgi:hypothetical protein